MTHLSAAALAEKFENCKQTGQNKFEARCPAHEDNRASLSIGTGNDGKLLVHCFAGCSTEDVLAKVGMSTANLMPPREEPDRRRRLVATYDYCDETGKLLYQAVRYEPKQFFQRVPDGRGGWIWKLNDVRRVLYRLPDLLKADLDEPVFILEGEKDCNRARQMGILATCNVGGASKGKSKWLSSYNESLRGRRVFVVPDNDEAGQKHAEDICAQLEGVAATVKLVTLPGLQPKGDFSDWANAGGTKEVLLALATMPEPKRPDPQTSGNPARKSDEPSAKQAKTKSVSPLYTFQKFPTRVLPGIIGEFVRATAAAIDCDESMIALPTIVTMAGAIGCTRQIRLKQGWTEPAVIWGAVIAESGSKKSPAIDSPLKALVNQEHANHEQFQEDMQLYQAALANHKADLQDWQKKKRAGEQPVAPEVPVCKRFIVNDITTEALAEQLKNNPRGVLAKIEELSGLFGGMNQYRAGGKGNDEAKWLSIHGARELVIDRKTGTKPNTFVKRAAVSIIGGIQPKILQKNFTREHYESGMAARFLMAYPPSRVAKWNENEVAEALERELADTVFKLQRLDFDIKDDAFVPVLLPLSPEAKQRFIEFHDDHAEEAATLSGDLSAAWSKLIGYAARLALVIQLGKWAQTKSFEETLEEPAAIDLESMEAGIVLAKWFSYETKRVYSVLVESEEEKSVRELLELINYKHLGIITPRDLQRSKKLYKTSDEAEAALQQLVAAGHGKWEILTAAGPTSRRFQSFSKVDKPSAKPEENSAFVETDESKTPKPVGRCDHAFPDEALNVDGCKVYCPSCGADVGFLDEYPSLAAAKGTPEGAPC